MAWWQVVLILIGSLVVGIGGGIALAYLLRRLPRESFRKVFKVTPKQQFNKPSLPVDYPAYPANQKVGKPRNNKEANKMVPLLSAKSIIIIVIGLIIGVGLGLAYWAVSPIEVQAGWPPIKAPVLTDSYPTMYQSTIKVSLISDDISFNAQKAVQRQGETYVSRMNAYHFWDFMSRKIAEQAPQYSHSAVELSKMILVEYDWKSARPALEITAISTDKEEAFFLAGLTPYVFEDYWREEEYKAVLAEYEESLAEYNALVAEREQTKTALLETETKLAAFIQEENSYDISLDPEYIGLQSRIRALETELESQADELTMLVAEGDTGDDYEDTLTAIERTSKALSRARTELSRLISQVKVETFNQTLEFESLNSEVQSLSSKFDELNIIVLGSSQVGSPPQIDEDSKPLYFTPLEVASTPSVVKPEKIRGRSALMMGAVLGMGGAWLIMNRRWLVSYTQSFTTPPVDEEEA